MCCRLSATPHTPSGSLLHRCPHGKRFSKYEGKPATDLTSFRRQVGDQSEYPTCRGFASPAIPWSHPRRFLPPTGEPWPWRRSIDAFAHRSPHRADNPPEVLRHRSLDSHQRLFAGPAATTVDWSVAFNFVVVHLFSYWLLLSRHPDSFGSHAIAFVAGASGPTAWRCIS